MEYLYSATYKASTQRCKEAEYHHEVADSGVELVYIVT